MSDKNKKIVIIDYELGNLLSLKRAIEFIGYNVVISNSTNVINNSEVKKNSFSVIFGLV